MKRIFVDTNVFVYAHDAGAPGKQARAAEVIASLQSPELAACISSQVLQEFYNTLTRKLKLTPSEAKDRLLMLTRIPVVPMTSDLVLSAADLHAAGGISFWDALIIAAANSRNCDEIWTEDLQTGRHFGNLNVVNPFAGL